MLANQKGSIVGFVAVGIVLTIAAVGLFYVAGQQKATTSQTGKKEPEITINSDNKQAPNKITGDNQTGNDKAAPGVTSENSTANNVPPQLSTAGPKETLASVISIGVLAAAGASYIRSRSMLNSL